MTRRTILVTGARGKTGREVVAQLKSTGDVTVRAGSRQPGPGGDTVRPVVFDWDGPTSWPSAVAGVDAVYLMRPDQPEAPELIADLVASVPEAHVVLLSEQGAEDLPEPSWERRSEAAVTEAAASWTLLRPTWFDKVLTDPRFYLEALRDEDVLSLSSAGAAVSWVDARDIAAVAVAALRDPAAHAGHAYTVTGDEAITVAGVADLLSDSLGRRIRALDPPIDDALAGLDPWLTTSLRGVLQRVHDGVFAEVTDDVQRVTGRPPRPLQAFVREHASLWQREDADALPAPVR